MRRGFRNGKLLVVVIGYEVASQGLSMISDGQGGAIITWQDQRGGNPEPHIYAQWINAFGYRNGRLME